MITLQIRASGSRYVLASACCLLVLCWGASAARASEVNWMGPLPITSGSGAGHGASVEYDPNLGGLVQFGGEDTGGVGSWVVIFNGHGWTSTPANNSPPGRAETAMAYDPRSGEMVVFGGLGEGPDHEFRRLGDTWTLAATASFPNWTELSPPTSPSARSGVSMVYDPRLEEMILFGGYGSGGVELGETWAFDGSTWTELSPTVSPPARSGGRMAYDAALGEVVLYGGVGEVSGEETELSDTWTFNGSTWTERPTIDSPGKRFGPSMAYDAALGEIVLFGGAADEYLSDTWTFDGANWNLRSPAISPKARAGASMAYDPVLEEIVLTEGDTARHHIVWYQETWLFGAQASPVARVDSPPDGSKYSVGAVVPTSFSCVDGAGSPGISACRDSDGSESGRGTLDTATLGPHTYTVTATSRGGQVAQSSIKYTVVAATSIGGKAPPAKRCKVPGLKGRTLKDAKRRLVAANCRLGKVKRAIGIATKDAKVSRQSAKAGRTFRAGTKVSLALG